MRKTRAFMLRLGGLFRKRSSERDLADEIDSHLQLHIADNLRAGMNPEEARRQALLKLGGVEATKESYRDRRGIPMLETLLQDLRYGLRMMRRSPGFTAVAVLSLALGIGANTAIFSVIDALLLRNLPVQNPERLVMAHPQDSPRAAQSYSYPLFLRIRDGARGFSHVSAISVTDRSNVTINGPGGGLDAGLVRVALVSGNYFSMLGVQPALGRAFTPDEDRVPGAHPLVVISDRYWQRAFARSSEVLGRTLTMNGTAFTIVGVTPRNFLGDWVGRPTDLWIPMAMQSQVTVEMPGFLTRGNGWLRIVARLQPGIRREQAQASADAINQQYLREIAGPNPPPLVLRQIAESHLELVPAGGGFSPLRFSFGQSLVILAVVVGLVLLIACANVAGLLLARATARQREMAVRLAVGAGQRRLIRQLLTESVLLSVLGGALGLVFSVWGTSAFSTFSLGPTQLDSRAPSQWISLDLHADARMFAFAAALCLLTGILFGLAPAFRGSRVSLTPSLTGRGSSADGRRLGLGKLLVIAQVALSILLLIGAGLFLRTLRNLRAQDLGLDRQHVLLVWASLGQTGRHGDPVLDFWRNVQERASALPGVMSAGITNQGLLNGWDGGVPDEPMKIRGRVSQGNGLGGWRTFVTPGFFEAAGIQLLAGRDFTERDTEKAHRVVIINQAMAHYYFGNDNPVGEYLLAGGPEDWAEIIGVTKDFTGGTPRVRALELPYYSYRQFGHAMERMCLVVRTAGNPAGMAARIRQELRVIDPALPILKIDTVSEQLDDVLVQERIIATLAGFFGVLAVLLACLGLYGVMSYTAARRTNEIGIRVALGASRRNVLGMVLKEALLMVFAGIAIGLPVALAATRLISAKLFGVSATDPLTIAGASLLMIAVAAMAGFLPAQRASKVDPMEALRCE
jgi:predicted permease